jgi:hypothetical protein
MRPQTALDYNIRDAYKRMAKTRLQAGTDMDTSTKAMICRRKNALIVTEKEDLK